MARKSSPHSSWPEVRISAAGVERRCILLSDELRTRFQLARDDLVVRSDVAGDIITASFFGHACEPARRERGRSANVVPLATMRRGSLKFWLGFQEAWENTSGKSYSFHHVSLTVYLGYEGELSKPQIFRSEWPGIRRWHDEQIGFQSPGAGHPHWQFDALRSIQDIDSKNKETSFARLLDSDTTIEFSPSTISNDILLAARGVSLEKMHFASAAPWWKNEGAGRELHMNAPENAESIFRWILASVSYIQQEIKRC
jgi:hypothetical protein